MAVRTWEIEAANARIAARLAEVKDVTIKDYVRETQLSDLPRNVAYRVDGVHVYVDILNMDGMLGITATEGVDTHRRTLRFLNLHYRAVARVLADVDAILVDFHNQRLHAVITKPYGDEAQRIHRAIALAQLIIDVLNRTGEGGDDPLPAAIVRVGIDSGLALAVNNGRRGHREPLFLGRPANLAAKRAGNQPDPGIFVTYNLRAKLGLAAVTDEDLTPLTAQMISASQLQAKLDITADSVVEAWQDDLKQHPIRRFEFSGHTPPYRTLDLEVLAAASTRRQDAVSIYADIDNFTNYVARNIDDDERAKDVVRVLHVLRSELDHVLTDDFAGVKVRFIGDCIHGLLVEGTAQTTDTSATIETAALCTGAMRSSFKLALEALRDAGIGCNLGLAVGFEYGPVAVTRLGIKGELIRCAIGRAVLVSEGEQKLCAGTDSGFGPVANKHAPAWLKNWFGAARRVAGVTYTAVVQKRDADMVSRAPANASLLRPAASVAAATSALSFPARSAVPVKPAGFAQCGT